MLQGSLTISYLDSFPAEDSTCWRWGLRTLPWPCCIPNHQQGAGQQFRARINADSALHGLVSSLWVAPSLTPSQRQPRPQELPAGASVGSGQSRLVPSHMLGSWQGVPAAWQTCRSLIRLTDDARTAGACCISSKTCKTRVLRELIYTEPQPGHVLQVCSGTITRFACSCAHFSSTLPCTDKGSRATACCEGKASTYQTIFETLPVLRGFVRGPICLGACLKATRR